MGARSPIESVKNIKKCENVRSSRTLLHLRVIHEYRWRMRLFARFLSLPPAEQIALVEAVLCLALAQLLLLVPFRRLAPLLGRPQPDSGGETVALDANQRVGALAVRRALLRASNRLPWHASCLVRALAARLMLWRRRMPSVLHLGARNASETDLAAHAWLRCGEIDVIGVEGASEYAPIVAFKA